MKIQISRRRTRLEIGVPCDGDLCQSPCVVLVASFGEDKLVARKRVPDVNIESAYCIAIHMVIELGTCLGFVVEVRRGDDGL